LSCAISPAAANIDLEWRPETQTVLVGSTVSIGLYAVSDDPDSSQSIAAMDVILNWDPDFLMLVGNVDNGPYDWSFSGFQDDSGLDGLNDTWLDGDALYTAHAQLGGDPAWATPEGLLVTTFQFTALAETSATILSIPESAGQYTETAVYDGFIPGLDVHGELGTAMVTIVSVLPGACCLQDQACTMAPDEDTCHENGGVYLGEGIPCEDQCSTGACCDEGGCSESAHEACDMGSICDSYWGADPPPQCMGDCNGDNQVDPQDVGLVKYYYGNTTMEALCRFDVNCDGTIAPQDVGLVKYHYTVPCGGIPPSYLDPTCVAYYGVPGEWYGYGTYCEDGSGGGVTCACACPEGAAHESSAWCGYEDPDPNGGCDTDPTSFDAIACGNTVCGMVSIESQPGDPGTELVDTDWYEFEVVSDSLVTWRVHSDFPAAISIYEADCSNLVGSTVTGGGGNCESVELTVSLPSGPYYAVVGPDTDALVWLPCTGQYNRYYAELQCTPPQP
jgi:hypothetical protein